MQFCQSNTNERQIEKNCSLKGNENGMIAQTVQFSENDLIIHGSLKGAG